MLPALCVIIGIFFYKEVLFDLFIYHIYILYIMHCKAKQWN